MDDGIRNISERQRDSSERRSARRSRFVGRDDVVTSIASAARRALDGRRSVVWIEAEAGMGKTFLLGQLQPTFERMGFEVMNVSHDRLAMSRPLAGFSPHMPADLLEDSTSLSSSPFAFVNRSKYDVVQRFGELLEQKLSLRPLAIVVDDLQFADLATVQMVAALIRHLDGLPVLFVVATRTALRPEVVDDLVLSLPADATVRHRLRALTEEAIVELATDSWGRSPTNDELAQLERSGGSPLFVQALLDRRRVPGEESLDSMNLEFREFVLHQMEPFDAETRRILEIASLTEAGFTLSELSSLTGSNPVALWGQLRVVLECGLLIETDRGFDFRHDLVKFAIYDALPEADVERLHRHAAETLIDQSGDVVRIANHLMKSGSVAGVEAVSWLRMAARKLAGYDSSEALRVIETAAEICPLDHPDRALLEAERVFALCWADRFADAVESAQRSLELATTPTGRRSLRLSMARALVGGGNGPAAADVLVLCLEENPDRGEEQLITALRGLVMFMSGDHRTAEAILAWLMQSSDVAPLPAAIANLVQSQAHSTRLEVREARAVLNRSIACAERDETGEISGYMVNAFRFYVEHNVDDLDGMTNAVLSGRAIAEQKGLSWSLPLFHGCDALRFRELGLLDNALADAETGLRIAEETNSAIGAALCVAIVTWVHQRRGDFELARQTFDDGARWRAKVVAAVGIDELLLVESNFALEAGDTEKARSSIEFMWDYIAAGNLEIFARGMLMPYLRLVVQQGDTDRVAQALRLVEAWQLRSCSTVPTYEALWLQARAVGRGSVDDMMASLALWRSSWRRIRFADALVDGVTVATSAGAKNLSKAWLTEARSIYESAGAYGSLARLDRVSGTLGVGERTVQKLVRPMSGWESLSPAEAEVAKLVAAGATNRTVAEHLVVSPRTVETHLSRVFVKLQLTSRRELAGHVRLSA
jgi:DNA-binding CsgD family transcriptional regulator